MNQQNYSLYRNADVKLSNVFDEAGNVQAHIVINGAHEHLFDSNSRISKALNSPHIELATSQLQARLTGGNYFFVEDQLIDFRDNGYNGFVHDDNAVDNLMAHIGVSTNERNIRSGLRLNTVPSDYMLMKKWSAQDFDVPGYQQGGDFTSNMIFNWNPFTSFIKGSFELVRQICTNGMVGSTELINSRIPLVNRWEEHLQIANIQMQNKVSSLVRDRLSIMGRERAMVSDLQLVTKHAAARRAISNSAAEVRRLDAIMKISDPIIHLRDYYQDNVFQDKNIAAQVKGHLTQFDCYNLATELSTHTAETEESTSGALQRLANGLLFPANNNKSHNLNTAPLLSAFSNPDQAFFGI